MIHLRILVEPTPKGRPRSRIAGQGAKRFVTHYTPAATRKTEAEIVAAIRQQLNEGDRFLQGVPLELSARFTRLRPQSAPRKRKWPVTKPDVNNYLGLLLDALKAYAYFDDAQICRLRNVDKVYGETPMIEVWIEEVTT